MTLFGLPLSPGHHIATTGDELAAMVREIRAHPERAIDWETDGLRYADGDRPIGAALGYIPDGGSFPQPRCWYVPFGHLTAERQADPEVAKSAIRDALHGASAVINHNLKFELNMARAWSPDTIPASAQLHDTMVQAYLTYEDRSSFSLENVAGDELYGIAPWKPGDAKDAVSEYIRDRAKQRKMRLKKDLPGDPSYLSRYGHSEVPVAIEGEYSCRDAALALLLDRRLRAKAQGAGMGAWQPARQALYQNEMLLVRALADMEWQGQLCDAGYLRDAGRWLDGDLDQRRRGLTAAFGVSIDWANDNELRDLIYGRLRYPVLRRTESGLPAVDQPALQDIERSDPRFTDLIEFNVRTKVRTTYTDSLAAQVCRDGRLHASYRQTGAATGRLSSAEPNLQNIPYRHEAMRRLIRQAFGVGWGQARLYLDYSQVELRFLAWITGAPAFVGTYRLPSYDAFLRGELTYDAYVAERAKHPAADIHSNVTHAVFGLPKDHPDHDAKRRASKVINFGIPYGGGVDMLTANPILRLDPDEAKAYLRAYHIANPEINAAKEMLFARMLSRKTPHFINWAGRTRHGPPALRSGNRDAIAAAQRAMFASWVQGSAAELTRFSLVRLWTLAQAGQIPARSSSTVHDEIQLDCDDREAAKAARIARRAMEDYPHFGGIPIIAEVEKTTTSWAEKAKWKTIDS